MKLFTSYEVMYTLGQPTRPLSYAAVPDFLDSFAPKWFVIKTQMRGSAADQPCPESTQ